MKKFILSMTLLSSIATAEENLSLSIAAHSLSGSYEKSLGEIIAVCSDEKFNIIQAPGITGGGTGNLEALANNKAQAAFVRSDVFIAIAQADASYKRFQTLVTLYAEPIHVLTLRESKTKKKGAFGFGTVSFNSLADIKDYPVGAGGGTVYTLKVLKGQGGGSFGIVQYDDGKELIAALDRGDIAAAVFVGSAPLPALEKLQKNKYRLIPVGESLAHNVKGIYKPKTINYPGLSDGPVYTLASTLVILTRKFSTKSKLDAQRHLRQCYQKSLDGLQDNGSPGWQFAEPNDKGVLDWYDIPG